MKPAIIIPALNEENTIAAVVKGVSSVGQPIVVSDGSTDGTVRCAETAGAVVLQHDRNRGYDAALRSGFEYAASHGYDTLISFDADGQFDAAELPYLLAPLNSGEARLALGVRSEICRWSERLFGLYTRMRFGVPDMLCGVKAFCSDVYIQNRQAMAEPTANTGLGLAALRRGIPFALVPLSVRPRADASRFGNSLSANFRICKILIGAIGQDLGGSRK